MAEPSSSTATWAKRLEILKDSAQQRVLNAPVPPAAMDQLIVDEKATLLGRFQGSPVHYVGRWWRLSELGWVALDEAATAQLDVHAERYRAATAGAGALPEPHPQLGKMPPAHPQAGAA